MQFTTTFLAVLATAGSVLAAPAPAEKSMMAAGDTWTIQSFKRVCGDGKCDYSFAINTNDGQAPTGCAYEVTGNPASQQAYQNVQCGDFTIGSTWSGQFGPDNGFQTLSVVRGKQILYPAYTDKQLDGGNTVKPDQSYTPQNLA